MLQTKPPEFAGFPVFHTGQGCQYISAAGSKLVAVPQIGARLFSVSIETAVTGGTVKVYDGQTNAGTLVASIDAGTTRTYLYGGIRCNAGIYVEASVNVKVTLGVEAAARTADLTLSGNEITDAVRALGVQGDGAAVPGGVGVWEGTTNLCTNGGFETDTSVWSTYVSNATVARITSDFKFGVACGEFTSVAAGTAYAKVGHAETGTPIAQTARTYSCWVKGVGATIGKTFTLQMQELGGAFAQQATAVTTVTLTGVFQRVTVTGTPIRADRTELQFLSYWTAAGAGEAIRLDGIQFEQKSIATPYVHTDGATASRSAARVQAPVALTSASTFWVAQRLRMGIASAGLAADLGFYDIRTDATHRVTCYYSHGSSQFVIDRVNVTADSKGFGASSFSAGDSLTAIWMGTATTIGIAVNGSAFVTGASTHIPTPTTTLFDLGSEGSAGLPSQSANVWTAVGTGTLTDADSAALYALGDTPPTYATLPAAAQAKMIWYSGGTQYVLP